MLQREVLSRYATERVTAFSRPETTMTRTDFETFTVIGNWSGEARTWEAHELAPVGFAIMSEDETVTAGYFTAYSGAALAVQSDYAHLLAVIRQQNQISIYKPLGGSTELNIPRPLAWSDATAIEAVGFAGDNSQEATVTVTDEHIVLTFAAELVPGEATDRYELRYQGGNDGGDAGPETEPSGDGGCGCQTSDSPITSPVWLLAIVVLARLRRRKYACGSRC